MTSRKHSSSKGFTLIELLTVISIIGILAAILIPTIAGALTTAKRMAAAANARSIGNSYQAYTTSGSNSRIIATPEMNSSGNANSGVAKDVNDVAFILAKNNGLNDATLWFVRSDIKLTGANIPKSVVDSDMSTATGAGKSFIDAKPKSYAFVTGLPSGSPPTTTPLLWTYGLQHDGTWVTASPWEGKGGHIGYLDGHVEWVDLKLSTDSGGISLVTYLNNPKGPNKPTVDYAEAINQQGRPSKVVNAEGTE